MPAHLLVPLELTGFAAYPVTVEALLVKIAELEKLVETANDRFEAVTEFQIKTTDDAAPDTE